MSGINFMGGQALEWMDVYLRECFFEVPPWCCFRRWCLVFPRPPCEVGVAKDAPGVAGGGVAGGGEGEGDGDDGPDLPE